MPEILTRGVPRFRDIERLDLNRAVRRGARDLVRAPGYAVLFAGVYVMMGWGILWITQVTGRSYWLILAAVGFPLIAPFAAAGFYEISRRLSRGEPLDRARILGVVGQHSRGQLPYMSAVILFLFLLWFFVGHMIFALFLGLSPMTNVTSSWEVYLTSEGLAMLGVGTGVGAGFAALIFMISVFAFPMLVERDIDVMTAMIASFVYVRAHSTLMFAWAMVIAMCTFVALIPGFLGLFVVLPLFGHATWHLYDQLTFD